MDPGSLEEHFQKEKNERAQEALPRGGSSHRDQPAKPRPKLQEVSKTPAQQKKEVIPNPAQPKKEAGGVLLPKASPQGAVEEDTDESGPEESEACSEYGEAEEEDRCSESSYAEKEADYGSSEDECYQIDSRRGSLQARSLVAPSTFRNRRCKEVPKAAKPVGEPLRVEDFVPE